MDPSVNRLDGFEIWALRRMLRISGTDGVSNEEVIRRANLEDRELFDLIMKRKISYPGHILHSKRYSVQRLILQGKTEGKRGIGRKRFPSLRNIRQ